MITLVQGDITDQVVDAIVNAANSSLMGGGGVDGAIHRKGGPAILAECRELRRTRYPDGLPTGEAISTTAGFLRARRVIHTVGPIWSNGNRGEDSLLAAAYTSCLEVATEESLATIAFPSISTGAYGFPIERAAPIALRAARTFDDNGVLKEIRFVLHSARDYDVFTKAWRATP
jgi:O-acetyl-ADP-ribose deacetylase (regulator of RNase III)